MLITLFTRASLELMVLVGKYVEAAVVRRVALVVGVGVGVLAVFFNLKYIIVQQQSVILKFILRTCYKALPILCKLKLKWSQSPRKAFSQK